jgi:hypothetical protein
MAPDGTLVSGSRLPDGCEPITCEAYLAAAKARGEAAGRQVDQSRITATAEAREDYEALTYLGVPAATARRLLGQRARHLEED